MGEISDMMRHGTSINCSTCVFFKQESKDKHGIYGFCQRFPPVLSVLGKKAKEEAERDDEGAWLGRYERSFVHWVQPAVYDGDWCGEYKQEKE